MKIEVIVPIGTPKIDYLNDSRYQATEIKNLLLHEDSIAKISRKLRMARCTVEKVARELNLYTRQEREAAIDPLHDPLIDFEKVKQLRKQGISVRKIAVKLDVSRERLDKVIHAYSAIGQELEGHTFRAVRPEIRSSVDYTNYHGASPEVVTKMLMAGMTIEQMTAELGLSYTTARKIFIALGAKYPTIAALVKPHQRIDPRNNPRCPVNRVQELQRRGYSKARIAQELGVAQSVLYEVLFAMKYDAERVQEEPIAA